MRYPVLLLTVLSFVGACDVTAPPTYNSDRAVNPAFDRVLDLQSVPRFSSALTAHGSFKPGEPIEIIATGNANLSTRDVEFRVVLPEVAAASEAGWETPFSVPLGKSIRPHLDRRLAMPKGGAIQERVTVTIPRAGYYRVVVSVMQKSDEPMFQAGMPIQNVAHVEGWLWIAPTGGRYTTEFDASLFPDSVIHMPGPLRAPSRRSAKSPNDGLGISANAISATEITVRASYYNIVAAIYEPVGRAGFEAKVCTPDVTEVQCNDAQYYSVGSGATDDSGTFTFTCVEQDYQVQVSTVNDLVTVSPTSNAVRRGNVASDCGSTIDLYLGSGTARSFVNTTKAALGSQSLLGVSRGWITVRHNPNAGNSYYSPSSDEITIRTASGDDHVWGEFGIFVAAHEYGHAVQEKALGGGVSTSCGAHRLDGPTNLQCAYSEGFADFHGAAVRSDLSSYLYRANIAVDAWFPGCIAYVGSICTGGPSYDGSIIEGAVAAFFYDIVDAAGDEPHDAIGAPGSYLAAILSTCEVFSGSWVRADGIDHIAYCTENSINPQAYFATRTTTPTNQRESATESSSWGWSSANMRSLWIWNLYDKR